ncbi:MAG TPA: hypothetical protein VHD32_12065 [Candidatus Didemnitutus sp.]|nr:hypothetical protein [Candidatus Didemnitutus sp.]
MPIDHSFERTPSFRDLTQTGLLLLSNPVVRSLRKLRELRAGAPAAVPVMVHAKSSKRFRRSPLPGSLS